MIRQKDGFNGERALVVPQLVLKMMGNDPLVSMLHITDIGYYPKARHHFRERKTPIDQYVLIYCLDGAGRYRIGSREFQISANQYFILPAGIPHLYAADDNDPWTIYWIHFKGPLAPYYAEGATKPLDILPEKHSRINNRLNIEFDYFQKHTSDLLLNKTVPYFLGSGSIVSNVGDIENKGIEFNITANIISTKDWGWESTFNFSSVKNEVTNLGGETRIFDYTDVTGLNGQPSFVYQVGESLGS